METNWIDLIRRYREDGFPSVNIILEEDCWYSQALDEVEFFEDYLTFKCGFFRIKLTNDEIKEVAI